MDLSRIRVSSSCIFWYINNPARREIKSTHPKGFDGLRIRIRQVERESNVKHKLELS